MEGSLAEKDYNSNPIYERHRHRYEYNNLYRKELTAAGLIASGMSPNEKLVEMVEIPSHRFYIASQFHPEFKSRPNNAHPLFVSFVEAAIGKKNDRQA